MGKTLQYELWHECNNHCVYCSLGRKDNCFTDDAAKISILDTTISEVSELVQGEVDTLGFIGGEFFQGQLTNPNVKHRFMSLLDLSNSLLNNGIIRNLWINATMTTGSQSDLYEALALIDKKEDLWVLTSYDTKGRFHTEDKLLTWQKNMERLHKEYPAVKVNTTMIITGDFIHQYMSGEFDLQGFMAQYHTNVFLKTPVKPDDMTELTRQEINEKFGYEFFPLHKDFLEFLIKYKMKEGSEAYSELFSNDLKAEEMRKNYNSEELRNVPFIRDNTYNEVMQCDPELKEIEALPCGHSNIYNAYSDCDGCVICDKGLVGQL